MPSKVKLRLELDDQDFLASGWTADLYDIHDVLRPYLSLLGTEDMTTVVSQTGEFFVYRRDSDEFEGPIPIQRIVQEECETYYAILLAFAAADHPSAAEFGLRHATDVVSREEWLSILGAFDGMLEFDLRWEPTNWEEVRERCVQRFYDGLGSSRGAGQE